MDTNLVDLIENEGQAFSDNSHVWMPFSEEARQEFEEEYFIDSSTEMNPGCVYIGTVGECRESIQKMREVSRAN